MTPTDIAVGLASLVARPKGFMSHFIFPAAFAAVQTAVGRLQQTALRPIPCASIKSLLANEIRDARWRFMPSIRGSPFMHVPGRWTRVSGSQPTLDVLAERETKRGYRRHTRIPVLSDTDVAEDARVLLRFAEQELGDCLPRSGTAPAVSLGESCAMQQWALSADQWLLDADEYLGLARAIQMAPLDPSERLSLLLAAFRHILPLPFSAKRLLLKRLRQRFQLRDAQAVTWWTGTQFVAPGDPPLPAGSLFTSYTKGKPVLQQQRPDRWTCLVHSPPPGGWAIQAVPHVGLQSEEHPEE